MHRRARKLIKFWWVMRDMGKAKIPFVGLPYPPPIRFNFEKWRYFADMKTLVYRRPEWVAKDKRVYACYKTEAIFGECADEKHGEKMARLKGGRVNFTLPIWVPIGGFVFCCLAILGLFL